MPRPSSSHTTFDRGLLLRRAASLRRPTRESCRGQCSEAPVGAPPSAKSPPSPRQNGSAFLPTADLAQVPWWPSSAGSRPRPDSGSRWRFPNPVPQVGFECSTWNMGVWAGPPSAGRETRFRTRCDEEASGAEMLGPERLGTTTVAVDLGRSPGPLSGASGGGRPSGGGRRGPRDAFAPRPVGPGWPTWGGTVATRHPLPSASPASPAESKEWTPLRHADPAGIAAGARTGEPENLVAEPVPHRHAVAQAQ